MQNLTAQVNEALSSAPMSETALRCFHDEQSDVVLATPAFWAGGMVVGQVVCMAANDW
ncbi:hypothetical protein NBM05_08930 [Rothia sp. AR01]|uniref:Uncharacterized protein n=1 Tax=Rothia santali TaxID=2949643 RepID=A0A9X2HDI1_9MICC|nr:hypothetical protein [Rothia santali]MCP3426125.1 hypothetical protein [Rothia santali]